MSRLVSDTFSVFRRQIRVELISISSSVNMFKFWLLCSLRSLAANQNLLFVRNAAPRSAGVRRGSAHLRFYFSDFINGGFLAYVEAHGGFLRFRRYHEFADGLENHTELLVVFRLQFIQSP